MLAYEAHVTLGCEQIKDVVNGTQDDLVRKENGWQIEPGNFEALLSTMKGALSDVARLKRMGEESYRIVKEEINIEKMVERFVEVLNLLTGK